MAVLAAAHEKRLPPGALDRDTWQWPHIRCQNNPFELGASRGVPAIVLPRHPTRKVRLGQKKEAPVRVELTMTDLQSVALATWRRRPESSIQMNRSVSAGLSFASSDLPQPTKMIY